MKQTPPPWHVVIGAVLAFGASARAVVTIIDEEDAAYAGSWSPQGGYPNVWDRYNQDWRYQNVAGAAGDTATYTFSGLAAGAYYVSAATAYNGQGNLTTDAAYTISDGAGVVHLNQRVGPRNFDASLAPYGPGFARLSTFNGYTPVNVTDGTLTVMVGIGNGLDFLTTDAIRVESARAGTEKVWVLGDQETGYSESGTWATFGGEFEHNHNFRYGNGSASWAFSGLEDGSYRLSATWTGGGNRTAQAGVNWGSGNTVISQIGAPLQDDFFEDVYWQDLAPSIQVTGGTLTVTMTDLDANPGSFLIADAVRLEKLAIPEPSGMLILGLASAAAFLRRKK